MVVFVAYARVSRRHLVARLACVFGVLLVAGACGSTAAKKPPTGTPEPDKFLFERGTEELNKRRWIVSREYFRQLVDSYPQSTYRADAKLGVGDTYIGEGSAESDVLAINEFREFLSFYPTHKRADYAQLKLGMAHFYQMRAPERDQTETREAIRELADVRHALSQLRADRGRPEASAGGEGSPRGLGVSGWRLLLPVEMVSRRDRAPEYVPERRSGIHQSRRCLLLPRRVLYQDVEIRGGVAQCSNGS